MKKLSQLGLIIAMVASFGCQNTAEKSVNNKMVSEKGTFTQAELSNKVKGMFAKNKKLTEKQRVDLLKLHTDVTVKVKNIRFKMGKIKGVFFKNLMADETNNSELTIARRKLVKLNDQKMNVMFDSMTEAKKILGKDLHAEVLEPFMFDHTFIDQM